MRSPLACLPPDLIAHIVSFYKGIRESPEFQGPRRNDRRTLLALTRTCRSLSEAALNRLWADLPSLAPLVYLLPDDAWKLDEHARSEYTPRVLVSIMVVVFYSCMTISRGSCDLYHQPITLGFTLTRRAYYPSYILRLPLSGYIVHGYGELRLMHVCCLHWYRAPPPFYPISEACPSLLPQ